MAGCAPILAIVGINSLSPAFQVAVVLDRAKLMGDGVSLLGSGKTVSDHALSIATGADCRIVNVVTRNPVCASGTDAATAGANVTVSAGPTADEAPQTDAPADSD